VGEHAPSATAAIEAAYARGINDEFVPPTVVDGVDGRLEDRASIIHANFRADRARQLVHALADPAFAAFDRAAPDGRPAPRAGPVVPAGRPVQRGRRPRTPGRRGHGPAGERGPPGSWRG